MAANLPRYFAVPVAAALLLWPALWNAYPIVFADTGTYLSQAIHRYAGWDRPVFYSLFMLPLHATVTVWPVVVVQALLVAWVLRLVCRVLLPGLSGIAFVGGVALLSVATWLPWLVSELMPDVFTPLTVLVLTLLAWVPHRLTRWERGALVGLCAFLIATQHSSLPLALALTAALAVCFALMNRPRQQPRQASPPVIASPVMAPPVIAGRQSGPPIAIGCWHRWFGLRRTMTGGETATSLAPPTASMTSWLPASRLIFIPPALAIAALCSVNLLAHGRFAVSPFGSVFLMARMIYDGPGLAVLQRECPASGWRLCPYTDRLPPTSDDFLWLADSPLNLAGGPKAVSAEAGAIIKAALLQEPAKEAKAALAETLDQLRRFDSGDGLNAWPIQVTPWIRRDFPPAEFARYAAALQQSSGLSIPWPLGWLHSASGVAGVAMCLLLLPRAIRRRHACAGFLLAILLALPISAAITGVLSGPHDRYQARIMWLPPFAAVLSLAALSLAGPRRRDA